MIASLRSILGRTHWSLRMHFWLWRENRALTRLQSRNVVLIADRLRSRQSTPNNLFLGDPTFITEMAKPLQLQSLLFGDGQSFIRGVAGEVPLDKHLLGCETPKRSLEEQEADLIAEYDADFLASIRIKPPVEPSSS